MLNRLSWRNAKRQFRDYMLYLITLICSAAFMFAFNSLIFSKAVKDLSDLEVLPYMIAATSILIIFVLGWTVSYMMNYMLRKRSRELSIYMVCGISEKSIGRIFFYENCIAGGAALGIGMLFGLLLSQLLEAVLLHMFGQGYHFSFRFILPTAVLTAVYFVGIFLSALARNSRWIRKMRLYDLLYYDRQNEEGISKNRGILSVLFLMSLVLGAAGIYMMVCQPLQAGYNIFIGLIFLVSFLFCFYISIPAFLTRKIEGKNVWKYRRNRLVVFRGFNAKIKSMSVVMGVLSIFFMLAMTFFGTGIAAGKAMDRNMELNTFDLLILHPGEAHDFSIYRDGISRTAQIVSEHEYCILTDSRKTFKNIFDRALRGSDGYEPTIYAEYQADTYMRQSDYLSLRQMLGYQPVELNKNSYYVHCIPAMEQAFTVYLKKNKALDIGEQKLIPGDVFAEPFDQNEAYGNGLGYIVIVPDHTAQNMKVVYSLFAAEMGEQVSGGEIQDFAVQYDSLELLNRNLLVSGSEYSGESATSLVRDHVDYISGKWASDKDHTTLYSLLLCLFYLAFILEITGAAILATQVLGDYGKKRKQNKILFQLGMEEKKILELGRRQMRILFLLPAVTAMIISVCLILYAAEGMQLNASGLPIFTNRLWIFQTIGGTIAFFGILYVLYYLAACISDKKQI